MPAVALRKRLIVIRLMMVEKKQPNGKINCNHLSRSTRFNRNYHSASSLSKSENRLLQSIVSLQLFFGTVWKLLILIDIAEPPVEKY